AGGLRHGPVSGARDGAAGCVLHPTRKSGGQRRCGGTGRCSDRAERRPQNTRRERQSMRRFVMAAVVIELQSTTQGASLKLGTEGLRLTLATEGRRNNHADVVDAQG